MQASSPLYSVEENIGVQALTVSTREEQRGHNRDSAALHGVCACACTCACAAWFLPLPSCRSYPSRLSVFLSQETHLGHV